METTSIQSHLHSCGNVHIYERERKSNREGKRIITVRLRKRDKRKEREEEAEERKKDKENKNKRRERIKFLNKRKKEKVSDFGTHLGEVLPHDLDKIGHGKVHDLVSPGQLQHHVGVQQVIGCKQAGGEALLLSLLQEPLEESLGQLCLL